MLGITVHSFLLKHVSVLSKFSKMNIYSFCRKKKSEEIIKVKKGHFPWSISWMQILPSPDSSLPTLSRDRGERQTRMSKAKNQVLPFLTSHLCPGGKGRLVKLHFVL